jgi:glycosyltransferase involved in cell wall biosynthesis
MKLISVVIPTYNCAKYVGSALKSVFDQSYDNIEVIVVDDGSTDDTIDVLQPFMNDIIYIHQENTGLPGARNRGIKEAAGEYVAFLDADDRWRKHKLEIQVKFLEAYPSVHIVFTDFSVFSEDGYKEETYFRKCFPIFHEYNFKLGDIFQNSTNIFSEGLGCDIKIYHGHIERYLFCGNFVLPSSALIRKRAIDESGGFDERYKIAEETEFFLRLCTSYNAGYVEKPLVDYLIKRTGKLTGSTNIERLIRNALSIQENYISKHPDVYKANRLLFEKAIARTYTRLAHYYLTMIMNKAARLEAKRSIFWMPFQFRAYILFILSFCPSVLLGIVKISKKYMKMYR